MEEFLTNRSSRKKKHPRKIILRESLHLQKKRTMPCHSPRFKNRGCLYLILKKINILEDQKILILIWVKVNLILMTQQLQKRRKKLNHYLLLPLHQITQLIIQMLPNDYSKLNRRSSWEKWKNSKNSERLFLFLQNVKLLKELIQTTK